VLPPRRRRGEKQEWPQARSGHASAVVSNLAIFFGGRHRAGRFNDINMFNTETMTWMKPQIRGKVRPRRCVCVCVRV
jgi:hypothetical protein